MLPVDFNKMNYRDLMNMSITKYMPARHEIPTGWDNTEEGKKWIDLQTQWFFKGLNTSNLKEKPGIVRSVAFTHLGMIQESFEPDHNYKKLAVAWLMSQWFEIDNTRKPPAPQQRKLLEHKPKKSRQERYLEQFKNQPKVKQLKGGL